MKPKTIRYFVYSAGALLFITALAKIISTFGNSRILQAPDPLLTLPFRYVFWIVGMLELFISFFCFFSTWIAFQSGLIAWITTGFVTYRLGLLWIGYQKPCPCLGTLTDALHIQPQTADTGLKIILGYLFIGSYAILFRLWQQKRHFSSKKGRTMVRKPIPTAIDYGILVFLWFIVLFGNCIWRASSNHIGSIVIEINAIFYDAGILLAAILCMACYIVVFSTLNSCAFRNEKVRWLNNGNAWLFLCVVLSLKLSVFIAGIFLAQAVIACVLRRFKACYITLPRSAEPAKENLRLIQLSLLILLIQLTSVALWHPDISNSFQYHRNPRWTGAWDNPNLYGMLMGTGGVIALGLVMSISKHEESVVGLNAGSRRWSAWHLLLFAEVLCGTGLFMSYSRGAWLGAWVGLMYCVVKLLVLSQRVYWFQRTRVPILLITMSIIIVGCWHFRFSQWLPVRRIYSASNITDFSWRNRALAWEGTLQMIEENAGRGFGLDQTERAYDCYYRPDQVDGAAAIQMNDYLMLGATLGIPSLFCFLMYVWLSLRGRGEGQWQISNRQSQSWDEDWLKVTCRAGAIVLLVGFWFDGGLFKLPTAATFWILLELGREDTRGACDSQSPIADSQEQVITTC